MSEESCCRIYEVGCLRDEDDQQDDEEEEVTEDDDDEDDDDDILDIDDSASDGDNPAANGMLVLKVFIVQCTCTCT